MKYIFKNLRGFIKNETAIFVITLVCVFSSAFILNFSCGLLMNLSKGAGAEGYELRCFSNGRFNNPDMDITKDEIQGYIEALDPDTLGALENIYVFFECPGLPENFAPELQCRFLYKDGKYLVPPTIREVWREHITGRYLTDEEYAGGALLAVLPEKDVLSRPTQDIGGEAELFGEKYTVIGKLYGLGSFSPSISFVNVPSALKMTDIGIVFEKPMTRRQYDDLKNTARRVIPGKLVFEEKRLPDDDTQSLYRNIVTVSVLVAVLSVMNFAMLYLFIVRERRSALAVMRICGARKPQAALIYLGECLALTIPAFLLGTLFFDLLLKRAFAGIFPYMAESFSPLIYIAVFVIYTAVMLVMIGIMAAKNVNVKIKDCLTVGKTQA